MKTSSKTVVDSYVPRHVRIGKVEDNSPAYVLLHEIEENVPLIGEDGTGVARVRHSVFVDAAEDLAKYRKEDFQIENLEAAGVPLSLVQVNSSSVLEADKLDMLLGNVERLNSYLELKTRHDNEINELFNVKNE